MDGGQWPVRQDAYAGHQQAWYGELVPRILPRPTPTPAADKPPPREVFDRTTFPSPHLFWTPAFAGMTNGGPKKRVGEPWNGGTPEAP